MDDWTPARIPDLTGRVAVVTGANSGIGFVTALELARHSARVVAAGRNDERGQAAVAEMRAQVPGARVDWATLDLGDLASVRAFAAAFTGDHRHLDLLVNNAGIALAGHGRLANGFERQFGVNHLGHFALTGLLLPSLLTRPGARVVTVSSDAHERAHLDIDDLQSERNYGRARAYGRSKLANLLFAFELHRRAVATGADLRSVAVHPGATATNIANGNSPLLTAVTWVMARFMRPATAGAVPSLYAAAADDVAGGDYLVPGPKDSTPVQRRAAPQAYDQADAVRLWDVSERLTGVAVAI
ncbi:MAG: SDR family NAD(P)-dependent oxidoreductase [Streptosporangiales bacterium]|nr:SDR family NAD(P)-dependent oxidoreductase [Streptosporangiales bacterium]